MYLVAIASTWPLTSRAKARSCSSRSASSPASTTRSKLSSGNLASTGTSLSTLTIASTRSPERNVYWSWNASGGSESRSRFPSSSSPTPPRAFGGRSACSSRARSFARASICAAVPSSLPRRSTISVAVLPAFCWVASRRPSRPSRRRSTFASRSTRRRSMRSSIAPSCASTEPSKPSRTAGTERNSHQKPPATAVSTMNKATNVSMADERYSRRRTAKRRRAAAAALFLRHLLGARRAIFGHALLLLVHPFAAHRTVAHHVAGSFLSASEQLVQESHLRPPWGLSAKYRRCGSKKPPTPIQQLASPPTLAKKKPRTPAPPRPVQAPQRRDSRQRGAAGRVVASDQRARWLLYGLAALGPIALVVVLVVVLTGGHGSSKSSPSGKPPTIDYAALPGLQKGKAPWPPEYGSLPDRLRPLGLDQLSGEVLNYHVHQHLDIYINGKKTPVPAFIGIDD